MGRILKLFLMMSLLSPCAVVLCEDVQSHPMYALAKLFPSAKDLTIPTLSDEQRARLKAYQASLSAGIPDSYDLKAYQTPVKDQNPRGSCAAFAFLGALEAFYARTYGLNALNKYTDGFSKYQKSFITNDCSLVCITPDCYANCEEFDLSEEYLIHIVHSTQPTNNPNVSHENICSFWSGDAIDMTSGEIASANGICLPREKYAPYFGNMNSNLNAYGTKHGHNDLGNIATQSGIKTVTVNGWIWADGDFYTKNPTALTQDQVDDFEYDTRHIPLEARKNAMYRPTSVQQLSISDARDVGEIEKYLANNNEVDIYVALGKLDMGDTVYYDNTPVATHPDGNPIARYPITPASFVGCTTAGCTGLWEGYDAAGDYYDAGHAMIIIAYDHKRQLFLLKNSWGNTLPYVWVPYQFIEEKATGGLIILDVRDPGLGSSQEAMWIGKWDVDLDGNKGKMVIRRTRPVDQPVSEGARIGSYYGADGVPHMVTGTLPYNVDLISLYVDFDHTEPPPYAKGTDIAFLGQEFQLAVYYDKENAFTFGNFAAGTTTWNGIKFGTLLSREDITMPYASGTFSMEKWKDRFRLFYNNGNEAYFEVLNIASSAGPGYYSVKCRLDQTEGNLAAIDGNNLHKLFFFSADPDLYYHTWETGMVSGLGVFGMPVMETPAYTGAFSYNQVAKPVLDPDEGQAKPFSVFRSPLLDTLSFEIGLLPFSAPVDIYLGISGTALGSELYLISPELTVQPLSAGLVKWRENQTAPVDEELFRNIPVSAVPGGKYTLYTLVTPSGSLNTYYFWTTDFFIPSYIPIQ